MLEPREIALLQALTQGGRLSADQARSMAQTLETARANGARANLGEIVVARRLATPEELERFLRSSGRVPITAGLPRPLPGWNGGPPPVEPESPTIRQFSTERFPAGTLPLPIPGQAGFAPGPSPSATRSDFVAPTTGGTRSDFLSPIGPTGTMRDTSPFGAPSPHPSFQPSEPFGRGELAASGAPVFTPQPDAPGAVSGDGDRTTNAQGLGPFRFEARIGEGRSGTVYRARHVAKDRVFAVKLLNAPDLQRSEVDRLLRESRAAQWLRHPNIVVVHEVGESPGGPPFLVEDAIEGPSLAHEVASGSLDARGAARIVSRVALALQSAHDQGIVHRDVKPSNILLDSAGEPFLSDFGLAREVSLGGKGSRLVGTAEYTAPEQATGEGAAPSRRSDVYSLGAVLFECLTGQPPFVGKTAADVARQVVERRAPRARKLESSVPSELEAVCDKALAKRPEERYATARELAEDLRRFLDGRPVQARPAAGGSLAGRHTLLIAGAAVAALALVGTGAGGVLLWRRHEIDRRLHEVRAALTARNTVDAEAKAVALLRDEPGDARGHALLAETLLIQHHDTDALEHAKIAAQTSRDGAPELVVLGLASLACEKPEEARAAWEKAVAGAGLEPGLEARARAGLAGLPGVTLEAARALVQRAVSLAPDDPDVAVACAQALLAVGDLKASLVQLEKARVARPKDEDLLVAHGLAVASSGDPRSGLAELDQALAAHADLVIARVARARVKLALGECASAIDDADEARRLGSRSVAPLVVAAMAKAWLGARDDAQARFGELEKAAPTGLSTALVKSQVLVVAAKHEEAILALGDGPGKSGSLLALTVRALLEKNLSKLEPARIDTEAALAQATVPDARWVPAGEDELLAQGVLRRLGFAGPEATVRAIRAELGVVSGRLDDAQRESDLAARAKDAPTRLAISQACLSKDPTAALALLDRALTASPDVIDLRSVRAQFRSQLGMVPQALEDYAVLIRLEPSNVQYRLFRSNVFVANQDVKSALADLDEAERLSPRPNAIVIGQKVSLLARTNKLDDARRAADRMLQIEPNNPECRFWRGFARYRQGDGAFDEDMTIGVSGRPEQVDWRIMRDECLTAVGRFDEIERDCSLVLDTPGNRLAPVYVWQFRLARAKARFLSGKGRDAMEDLRLANEAVPDQPSTIGLRAMVGAQIGAANFTDDVKKLASSQDPHALDYLVGATQVALKQKVPGPWELSLVALADLAERPELKLQLLKWAAIKAKLLGEWADLATYSKKLEQIAPSDPDVKVLLEISRQH